MEAADDGAEILIAGSYDGTISVWEIGHSQPTTDGQAQQSQTISP